MRKITAVFAITPLLIILFFSALAQSAYAQVASCDPVSGARCTQCFYDINTDECLVDTTSQCYAFGYVPDAAVCAAFDGDQLGCQNAIGDCSESPPPPGACQLTNQSCAGPSDTQSNCCAGNTCQALTGGFFCVADTYCQGQNQTCAGPSGSQSNCCNGLECQLLPGGYFCQPAAPPPWTGYFCDGPTFGCFPCYAGSTNTQCNPPEYSDSTACQSACSGSTPTMYSCINGQCVEDQNGPYSGLGACSQSCVGTPAISVAVFCDGSGNPTTDSSSGKLYTAIGCIPIRDADLFLGFIVPWAIGIAGGVAFLLIIYAGFQIITSAGNPQKLQAGKELLTAAVGGLLLLLFSAFILDLVGVDILQIPGFG